MINFAMIYYLRGKYGLSSSLIGVASSIYTVTYFISCLSFSSLYPHLRRAQKVFIAFFGMAFFNVILLLCDSVVLTFVSLGLYGVAMSFLWPNMEDWITEGCESDELSKATNSFNFSWSLGAGLSTMIAGILVEISPQLPIAIASFLFILILIFLLQLNRATGENDVKTERRENIGRPTLLRYFSWCGNFLNYACYSLIINIFPLYALDILGYDEATSGTLLIFRGLSSCLAFTLFSRLSFWQFNKRVVLLSQLALSILFLIFSRLTSFFSIAVFFVFFGTLFSLLYEMSIFHGASGAKNRERRMIVHEVLLNIGMVLGATMGGIIYEHFSFSLILYFLSLTAFVLFCAENIVIFILAKKGISL